MSSGLDVPMTDLRKPLVLGIAGGSGSGKSTIARALAEALGSAHVAMLEQDCYYADLSHRPFDERLKVNFDHPDAIEFTLLRRHVDELVAGRSVDKPQYDFETHLRMAEHVRVEARPVIIVEGILVLADESLRHRMDLKLFVDTDPDIRVFRRIRRDLEHRGRTFAQVRKQYYQAVRPMHLAFVEPSKRMADVIIPEGGQNRVALELILGRVREFLREFSNHQDASPST